MELQLRNFSFLPPHRSIRAMQSQYLIVIGIITKWSFKQWKQIEIVKINVRKTLEFTFSLKLLYPWCNAYKHRIHTIDSTYTSTKTDLSSLRRCCAKFSVFHTLALSFSRKYCVWPFTFSPVTPLCIIIMEFHRF